MPIYEYKCKKCGKEYEEIMVADEIFVCPHCGYICKKMISLGTFVLKGRGWAADGYSKGSRR